MAGKRNGLGKGLDSLIPNKTVKEESASQQKVSKEKQEKNVGSGEILVKINEVEPNREQPRNCLLYTSPSPRDVEESRMPSSA